MVNKSNNISMIGIVPEELQSVLMQELMALGATNVTPGFRAVHFDCDETVFYRVHLCVRTASRFLRVIKEFSAAKKEIIFDQSRRVRWPDIFDVTHSFVIESFGDSGTESITSGQVNDKVREGIVHAFNALIKKEPKATKFEPRVTIVAFLRKGRVTLSVDTSGKSLHKRGYREEGHPAPLKETLAAGILKLLKYDGSVPLWDPMCGSGTLVIEAAQIAMNKAPLIHRAKGDFGFEWLKYFDNSIWRKVQDETRAAQKDKPPAPIHASDIESEHVALARRCSLSARVEKFIDFKVGDFRELKPTEPSGLVVANLPYGARLNDPAEIAKLYKEIGDALKKNFSGWCAALLMPDDIPSGSVGLKATKTLKLTNGGLKVKLLIIDLYAGSKRQFEKVEIKA